MTQEKKRITNKQRLVDFRKVYMNKKFADLSRLINNVRRGLESITQTSSESQNVRPSRESRLSLISKTLQLEWD